MPPQALAPGDAASEAGGDAGGLAAGATESAGAGARAGPSGVRRQEVRSPTAQGRPSADGALGPAVAGTGLAGALAAGEAEADGTAVGARLGVGSGSGSRPLNMPPCPKRKAQPKIATKTTTMSPTHHLVTGSSISRGSRPSRDHGRRVVLVDVAATVAAAAAEFGRTRLVVLRRYRLGFADVVDLSRARRRPRRGPRTRRRPPRHRPPPGRRQRFPRPRPARTGSGASSGGESPSGVSSGSGPRSVTAVPPSSRVAPDHPGWRNGSHLVPASVRLSRPRLAGVQPRRSGIAHRRQRQGEDRRQHGQAAAERDDDPSVEQLGQARAHRHGAGQGAHHDARADRR